MSETNETLFSNSLVQLAKSVERISDELSKIRKILESDLRYKVTESKNTGNSNKNVITEGKKDLSDKNKINLEENDILDNVKSIINGDFLK